MQKNRIYAIIGGIVLTVLIIIVIFAYKFSGEGEYKIADNKGNITTAIDTSKKITEMSSLMDKTKGRLQKNSEETMNQIILEDQTKNQSTEKKGKIKKAKKVKNKDVHEKDEININEWNDDFHDGEKSSYSTDSKVEKGNNSDDSNKNEQQTVKEEITEKSTTNSGKYKIQEDQNNEYGKIVW